LETPHRWIKAENEALGRWLLNTRSDFRQEQEPDYRGSPIDIRKIRYADLGPLLVRLTYEKQGRICVIGPKARPLATGIETTLVNKNYRILEPNDLSALRSLIIQLSDGSPSEKADAAFHFLTRAHGGLSGDNKTFVEKILRGENQRPRRADRRLLCKKYNSGTTPQLVFDLLEYIERIGGTSCKLTESISVLKCIVEEYRDTGTDLKTLYADEIGKRKYQSRSNVYRCIGSTLLVKGLEFDHCIILRSSDWQRNWGNHKDLYVALTRGSKTTTLMELTA